MKYVLLSLVLLCGNAISIFAAPAQSVAKPVAASAAKPMAKPAPAAATAANPDRDARFWDDCCDHTTVLKVAKLCAEKIKVRCLRAQQAQIDLLGADNAILNSACVKNLSAETANTNLLKARDICADDARITNLCATNLSSPNLCFDSLCNRFRAFAGFAADTVYTLGTDVNYDTIADDPNGNILTGPTRYVAPKSGWYHLALRINMQNPVTSSPVLGIPVQATDILVNGILRHRQSSALLAFSNVMDTATALIIRLNAGDIVTVQLKLLVQDPATGLTELPGTITLVGVPGTLAENDFAIIYLTSFCNVCPPCSVPTCTASTPVSCPPLPICPCE